MTVTSPPSTGVRAAHMRRGLALVTAAIAATLAAAILGLGLGSHPIAPATVIDAVFDYDPSVDDQLIVMASRLPRIVLGIVVGMALGLAGCLMQSMTRNPLADPGILGVNAGASLAIVFGIAVLGFTQPAQYVWLAFAGAAIAATIVWTLGSAHRSVATPARVALAGTAVSIALGALTQMVLISNETTFQHYRFWAVGSLQGRGFDVILTVLPFIVIGVLAALLLIRPLNAVALGDDAARALGTNIGATRIGSAAAVVLLAGAATAAAGPIAFIGLAAPHLVRLVTGNDHRWLVPGSAVVGAALLVVFDTAGRALAAPAELQTGIATALLGGPVFVMLVRSRRVAGL